MQQRAAHGEGVGEDTADLLAHLLVTDLHVGEDRGELHAHLLVTDAGIGSDTVELLAHLAGADQGVGVDSASWLLHVDRAAVDVSSGQDTAALLAHLLAADTAVGQDAAALLAHLIATDSGAGSDAARPVYMNAYSGSKSATTVPNSETTWTDLLSYTAAGNGTATVNFSVSHSWGSNGLHWVSEPRGIRILVAGAQVAIQTQNYSTGSWSTTLTQNGVTVAAGSSVQIQGMAKGSYSEPRTVTISSASMAVVSVS